MAKKSAEPKKPAINPKAPAAPAPTRVPTQVTAPPVVVTRAPAAPPPEPAAPTVKVAPEGPKSVPAGGDVVTAPLALDLGELIATAPEVPPADKEIAPAPADKIGAVATAPPPSPIPAPKAVEPAAPSPQPELKAEPAPAPPPEEPESVHIAEPLPYEPPATPSPEPSPYAYQGPSLYIVQITPEMAPVAKVGGLGDVVFGLSRELAIRGNHVEIILPKYDSLRYDHIFELHVAFQDLWVPWYEGAIHCTVYFGFVHDRKCFFIEPHSQDNFFNRGAIYGFSDDLLRYAFFSRAAMEFLFKSGKHPDVIHCHDWQTALVPVFLFEIYQHRG